MTEKTNRASKAKRPRIIDLKWGIPLLFILGSFAIQFLVTPVIGLTESENNVARKLWVSADDIPPLNLIYTVSADGLPLTDYSPSFSYTLQIRQRLTFSNPLIWSPSKTYRAPYEGCELVRVQQAEHIRYRRSNNIGVALWPTARYFDKRESSIELVWELSDCGADNVSIHSQTHEKGLRVRISNDYDYPIQYLGMVELPPIRSDTLYTIEDSPPALQSSKSLEIQTENSDTRQFQVDFPFIIELPEHMLITFDIQITDETPKISLPNISILLRTPTVAE